jgi:hypothetical protein
LLCFIGVVIIYLYRVSQRSPTMFCGIATLALIEPLVFQIFILDKIIILRV